jgi:hypothetical protein
MKKQKLLGWFCLWLLISGGAVAQGLYVKAGAGYNLGLPKSYIDTKRTYNDYSMPPTSSIAYYSTYTNEGVYDSYGKGLGFDAALGYKGEVFGLEVGVQYQPTNSIEVKSIENDYYTSSTSIYTYTATHKNSMLAISPCLVFKTDIGFYGRAGVVLGFPKLSKDYKDEFGSNDYEYTYEYTGNMALGYTGAIGIAIGGGGFKLYVEANVVSLTWAPTRGEITVYKVNGIDQLSTLTTSYRVTMYDDSYTNDSRVTTSSDQETKVLKEYMPFSSVGLKAGIAIGF